MMRRSGGSAGSRRQESSIISSTMSRCRGRRGCRSICCRQVEPFPTQEIVPYDTAFLSGHVVEHYQVVLLDAAQRSQEQMHAKLQALCAQQVPGDTHRNLRHQPELLGPDVQARPRAGLAAVVQLRREGVSGDRQRLHRADRRQSSVTAPGRSSSPSSPRSSPADHSDPARTTSKSITV